MDVAVKEFLPRTAVVDLMHEAKILASLSHPNLPYLFGVYTKVPPTTFGHAVSWIQTTNEIQVLVAGIEATDHPKG